MAGRRRDTAKLARAYVALTSGTVSVAQLAQLLGIKDSMARRYARRLWKELAAIKPLGDPHATPRLWTRGDRWEQFERDHARELEQRRGALAPLPGDTVASSLRRHDPGPARQDGLRVHNDRYRVAVSAGPRAEPTWQQRNERMRGLVVSDARYAHDGREFLIQEFRAKKTGLVRSLLARPHPGHVGNAADVKEEPARRRKFARDALVQFAKDHGYALGGEVGTSSTPLHYGKPIDGVEPFGSPGRSRVWGDKSLGRSKATEVETDEDELAAAWLRLPDTERRVGSSESSIEQIVADASELRERQQHGEEAMLEVLSVVKRQTTTLEALAATAKALAEGQAVIAESVTTVVAKVRDHLQGPTVRKEAKESEDVAYQ